MKFDLKKPCRECPFRTDSLKGWLGKERAADIIDGMYVKDQTFSCHKTVEYSEDLDEETGDQLINNRVNEQHCAGAMILMERKGRANQLMRIAERLRIYDRNKLKMDSPVFQTQKEFIKHHTEHRASRTKKKT